MINKNHFLMNINIQGCMENINNIVNKNQGHIIGIHCCFHCNLNNYLMGLVDYYMIKIMIILSKIQIVTFIDYIIIFSFVFLLIYL